MRYKQFYTIFYSYAPIELFSLFFLKDPNMGADKCELHNENK